jgi:plastocyanin
MEVDFMNRLTIAAAFLICGVFIQGVAVAYAQEAARTIEIHAKRFSFSPAEITIKKGETVKLVITSDDVTHSLLIPDLHVNATTKKDHPADGDGHPRESGRLSREVWTLLWQRPRLDEVCSARDERQIDVELGHGADLGLDLGPRTLRGSRAGGRFTLDV